MQQFSRKSFILAIFILCLTNVCKLQNNSRQLFFSEYVNEGDQLLARYQYKEAKYKYLLALHQITSKHKEYSKLKLKIWEINHNLFIFNNDSIFFNEILNAELKTNEDIIQAYCLKAMGHLLNQEYEMAKTYLDKVDKISSKLQNSTYYLTLAKYYAYKSNMPESTKACFKALNDAVKRNDNLQISNIYSKLSRNYLHESLYDESIKYARKSIQIQKNSNLINNLGQNYEVAMYYFYLDSTMQDSVLYYAKESLNYAKLSNDLNTQIYQYLNLATLFAPINKNKALEYLNELNNLKSEYSIPLHILSNIDLYLGVFEMENGNYEKAIEIFTNLKDRFADQSRSEEHLCFEYLSKCYLLTGKLDKALEMEKMRCLTKENYESARSRKDLLESELKYELLQKDRIILKDKLTILEKELNAKKYTQLYNTANFENILLNQKQTLADAINQNLKNQITINNQRSKLKINEKELTILRKNKAINTTIAISVSVLALISLIFLKLIWDKSRSLKNLETLFAQASQNLTNAKKHLEVLDSNSKPFISSSIKNQIEAISSDFSTFEMEINRIVDDTKNFKFQVHHEIKEPILQIQTLLARLTNSTNITNNEKETLSLMENHLKSMKETTEKMMLLSKIQKIDLQFSNVDLFKQVNEIKENLETQHGIQIECNFNGNSIMQADPLLMNIVWQNMLSNSIKYRNQNVPINITIKTFTSNGRFNIEYSDNGQGVKLSDQKPSVSRQFLLDTKSNKIGLTIIQSIVEKQNGNFIIVNNANKGSTFIFQFPA